MMRPKFAANGIYHIYNRGVEKRKVFLEDSDYFRFIHDLFEFNDSEPSQKLYIPKQFSEVGLPKRDTPRKLFIEIMAFCLMPNHFHLLVRQKQEKGITEFMRKLGTGYTNYFNQKYQRVGALFQGKFKAVHINQENHFVHLPYYIHLNPLDLIMPEWRKRELKDFSRALKFLENYQWSSYLDYIGKKNFPSVTQRSFLTQFFNGESQYKKDMIQWLKELNIEDIRTLILEQPSNSLISEVRLPKSLL